MKTLKQLRPEVATLVEICLLFLPAIPMYIWVWPNLAGNMLRVAHIITYGYVLAGTIFIGLRYWSLDELGVNRKGIWTSLFFGLFILLGRSLVLLSVDWGKPVPQFQPLTLVGEFFFYFAMVGITEELLFRGLVYRAFENWLGTGWAIWGSTMGFILWHIFGQGPLIGAAMLLYGLIFALMRWRAGGILGLIIMHGAMDYGALLMTPDIDVLSLGRPEIPYPAVLLLGLALILVTPLVLWKFYPKARWFASSL